MYKWAKYNVYDTDDGDTVGDFLRQLPADPDDIVIGKTRYIRLPASFDIETTRSGKLAYMYHGQIGLGDNIFLFRRWEQYEEITAALQNYLKHHKLKLIIWVANLGHEFSFIMFRHKWTSVFAKQPCQPLRAIAQRLEFRESLSISGQGGLAQLAKKYCETKKAKGDLDYKVMRNYYSRLNTKEKGYTIADVAILLEFGWRMFELYVKKEGDKIPMTQTGICRKMIQDAAEATGKAPQIRQKIRELFPRTPQQYDYLMARLFRGGYTHANVYWVSSDDVSQVIPNVIGYDYTSSYPAVMLHYKYPYTRFIRIHDLQTDGKYITDPRCNLDEDALILNITYYGLKPRTLHSIESDHKIVTGGGYAAEGVKLDNGRVICADRMTVCQTELDYKIFEMFYDWDRIEIITAQTAKKGFLPKYLTQPLLDNYIVKCRLKDQDMDGTLDYKNAKAAVNSFYGMTVQRLNFTEWKFNPDNIKELWYSQPSRTPYWKMIKNQLLSPFFGIWCTAWARFKLLSVVYQLDPDRDHFNVIYCDTDSIYMIDTPRNRQIIKDHNESIQILNNSLPKECQGKKNFKGALGCFEAIENGAHYEFKTLGAKRYIKLHDGKAEVTVAGMRKGSYERAFGQDEPPFGEDYCIMQIEDEDNPDIKHEKYISKYDLFAHFRDGCIIDVDVSGKLYSKYSPYAYSEMIDGVLMQELSGVALIPIGFKITMADYYKSLIAAFEADRRHALTVEGPEIALDFDDLDDTWTFDDSGNLIYGGLAEL